MINILPVLFHLFPCFQGWGGIFENELQTLKLKKRLEINSEYKDYILILLVPSTVPENSRCSGKTG